MKIKPMLSHQSFLMTIIAPIAFRGWRHWYDIHAYAGWKIQKHTLKDRHYRVISPDGTKMSYDSEQGAYDYIQALKDKGVRPKSNHLVVVVPGLNNALFTFSRIKRALRDQGYDAVVWDYPSNRANVLTHAERLKNLICGLEGIKTVSFVTHSLGGLILRTVLADETLWGRGLELGKIIMIAPPHKGSFVADMALERFKMDKIFDFVTGEVGHDLTTAGATALPDLKVPVSIIVGGTKKKFGFNPLSSHDNDGLVSVESSRVDTAVECIQIPYWSHTTMLLHKKTSKVILEVFEKGG